MALRAGSRVVGCPGLVVGMEEKEVELLFEQLWHIPQHLDKPAPRREEDIKCKQDATVRSTTLPPPLPPDRLEICYLGVEEAEVVDLELQEEDMADRGLGGCGEPGHFKQSCDKKGFCFICKATNHPVEECRVIKRPPQIAKYIGSAATGLGFFHIEIPDDVVVNPVATTKNYGLVLTEKGNITKSKLVKEFAGRACYGVAEDPPPPSDDNGGRGNEDQANGRQDGMETDISAPAGNASVSSNSVTPNASSPGHVVRRVAAGGDDVKEYVSGSEIYDMLLKKGCIADDGRFVRNSGSNEVGESVREEVQMFLMEDQEHMSCQQRIALEGENMDTKVQEVALPEEIMPSFEKIDMEIEEKTDGQGRTRENKVWGPVQATRQSSRVDISMNVMEKAMEYKRRSNLDEPNKKMKGIIQSNAFQSLDVDDLGAMARNVGIDISVISSSFKMVQNTASVCGIGEK
ncbi:hypothetical protein QYE76_071764 [Lolium multiflorum]|uniref:Uncharacterized protein n=1 Tax=Lolium multiflorum TaxID=4521 RepID=A0AAD8WH50_LOLMU|nr:hypothetical protein QYE76_071764 [Lolium multiflorum]